MTEQEWLTSTDPRLMLEYLKGPATLNECEEAWGQSLLICTYETKRISERKARLFGIACCRLLADLYDEPHCQMLIDYHLKYTLFERGRHKVPEADCCVRAIEFAERSADETVSNEEYSAFQAIFRTLNAGIAYKASEARRAEYEHRLVATSIAAWAIEAASCGATHEYRLPDTSEADGPFESLEVVLQATANAAAYRKGFQFATTLGGSDSDNMAANANLLRDIAGNPFRPITADPSWLTSAVLALAEGVYADRAFDRLPVLADALQDAGCENADILNHCRGDGPHARGCWVVDLLLGKE